MSADEELSWPAYFRRLQAYLQWQTDQIIALQRTVASLQSEMTAVKEQKGVRIDKIEYNFDQLKVERLDGTLNIGITPGGLQSVEEFAVNGATATIGTKPGPVGGVGGPPGGQAAVPNASPDFRGESGPEQDWLQQIEDHIHGYLSEDMTGELRQWVEQRRVPLDESSQRLVIDDIRAQVDDRIRYYAKQEGNRAADGRGFETAARDIIEMTKRDIRTAVERYIAGISSKDGEP